MALVSVRVESEQQMVYPTLNVQMPTGCEACLAIKGALKQAVDQGGLRREETNVQVECGRELGGMPGARRMKFRGGVDNNERIWGTGARCFRRDLTMVSGVLKG